MLDLKIMNKNYRCPRKYLFKYLGLDSLEKILSNATIKFAPPKSFNDPFDMQHRFDATFSKERAREIYREAFTEMYQSNECVPFNSINPKASLAALIQLLRNELSLPDFLKQVEPAIEKSVDGFFSAGEELTSFWDSEIDNYRVFCMSEINDDTKMWAHYADKNSGAVIKLEMLTELDRGLTVARKCVYQDNPLVVYTEQDFKELIKSNPDLDVEKLYDSLLYTKDIKWSDEKEWRVVIPVYKNENFDFYSLHKDELSEIYFGYRVSDEIIDKFIELSIKHFPGLKFFKAYKSLELKKIQFNEYLIKKSI